MQPTRTVVGLVWTLVLTGPGFVFGQSGDFLGRPAADWVRQLTVTDVSKRRGAAFALGRMGTNAEIYLPRLVIQAIKDDNPGVRETAAMAVGDILLALRVKGSTAQGSAESHWNELGILLGNRLGQETHAGARRGLIYALGVFGPAAARTVPALRTALKDNSSAVRQNAAWALGSIGPAGGAAAVADLCDLLRDAEPLVRRDAATALGDIGLPTAAAAVKLLLDLIDRENKKTGDPVVFKTALDKLVNLMSERDQDQAERLYPFLEAEDLEVAQAAAFALGNMGGPKARPALKVLRATLQDEDPQVQEHAASALGIMKKEAVPALVDLTRALEASTPGVRRKAAVALARISEGLHKDLSKNPDDAELRATYTEWLKSIEPAVAKLARVLKGESEPDLDVRRYAAEALFFIDTPANEKAIPAVVEVIRKDPNPPLRHITIDVLFHIKDVKQNLAEATLLEVLQSEGEELLAHRYEAARVLAFHLNEGAPAKVGEVLLQMLKEPRLELYQGAESRVGDLGENRGNTGVKENRGGDARFLAAQALGWMGRTANKPAIMEELTRAQQQDKDPRLKMFAAEALERIRRGVKPER